jgi:very-short-patch-repair endonuclease
MKNGSISIKKIGSMESRKSLTQLARNLRKNQTPAEKLCWEYLRKRRIKGYRFLHQKPLIYQSDNSGSSFFIADFYCAELRLVIEIDGPIHDYQKRRDYDRDRTLEGLGIGTYRLLNDEVYDAKSLPRKLHFIVSKRAQQLKKSLPQSKSLHTK